MNIIDEIADERDRLREENVKLKSLLRYIAYQRLTLGDKVIDHLDFERQKLIEELL